MTQVAMLAERVAMVGRHRDEGGVGSAATGNTCVSSLTRWPA